METMNAATVLHSSVHGPTADGTRAGWHLGEARKSKVPLSTAFHIYAARMEPGRVTLSVDGHVVFRLTESMLRKGQVWVFDKPFYLLLNLAVGGVWPGPPDRFTNFPTSMFVDWVRVYE